MLGEDLDGDGAVEAGVAGLVHLTHAALADLGGDLVRAERGAGLERHRYGTNTSLSPTERLNLTKLRP